MNPFMNESLSPLKETFYNRLQDFKWGEGIHTEGILFDDRSLVNEWYIDKWHKERKKYQKLHCLRAVLIPLPLIQKVKDFSSH